MDYSKEIFRVQCHNLLNGCMNEKIGTQIGKTVGVVKTCDVEEDRSRWGKVLRLCIEMDL